MVWTCLYFSWKNIKECSFQINIFLSYVDFTYENYMKLILRIVSMSVFLN